MILENKVISITGAANGIGKSTAKLLAEEGAILILSDVNKLALEETAHELAALNSTIQTVVVDVAYQDQIETIAQLAKSHYGRLDGAFNNAGISGPSIEMMDYPDDVFDQLISVNLKSIWWCMKSQLKLMVQQPNGGSIVNAASVGGLVGKPLISPYIATKHAVIGLTKTAALEYGSKGVRVNAVCPGIIRTPMLDAIIKSGEMGTEEQWNTLQPIGRLGDPHEIGELVAWLLSNRASLIHGQSIAADGGFTIS